MSDRFSSLERWTIDFKQAAALLGIGLRTLQSLYAAGNTPAAIKVGRRTLFRADEFRAWFEAGCVKPREKWEQVWAQKKGAAGK